MSQKPYQDDLLQFAPFAERVSIVRPPCSHVRPYVLGFFALPILIMFLYHQSLFVFVGKIFIFLALHFVESVE